MFSPTRYSAKLFLIAVSLCLLLAAAGCRKPQSPSSQESQAAAPFSNPPAAAADAGQLELSQAVARILQTARRSGALIYRGGCAPERRMIELYRLPQPVRLEPMDEALKEITGRYPELRWRETASGLRMQDSAIAAGLLKVRIREFTVVQDRGPEAALAALWRTPEIISYMANHDVRFARADAAAARGRQPVVIIHMKNSTVQEIVERITAGARGTQKIWIYRECRTGAETLVQVKIL
ncbi:MAG TPA: hypothetical protein VLT16_08325 [Candidatus Limnocylindrales bacterium]|nr:hypothetical protein [Candidatus Limnocylindrales bacterium]